MYAVAYIAIGALTAIVAGVWIYHSSKSTCLDDYFCAVLIGIFWPIVWLVYGFVRGLEAFMQLCIELGKELEESESRKRAEAKRRQTLDRANEP